MGMAGAVAALGLLPTEQGLTTTDWLRITIYSMLPIAEMSSGTYLLIFIRELFQKSDEELKLESLRQTQSKLNEYKALIEEKLTPLNTAIANWEDFNVQKANFVEYNLRLIEARYRRIFMAEEAHRESQEAQGLRQPVRTEVREPKKELASSELRDLWKESLSVSAVLRPKESKISMS